MLRRPADDVAATSLLLVSRSGFDDDPLAARGSRVHLVDLPALYGDHGT